MVRRRRDGAVEWVQERGVQRAEGEFADDMREIERCGKEGGSQRWSENNQNERREGYGKGDE